MRMQNLSHSGRLRAFGDIDLSNPVTAALAAITPTLTFSTNLTPPIPINLTGGGGGGGSNALLTLLQPTLTLQTPAGNVVIAPAGPSLGVNGTAAAWAAYAGMALAALIGFGAWLGYQAAQP